MITEPDLILLVVLQAGFSNFTADPSPLTEIFSGHTTQEIETIVQYFSLASNVPNVRLGYPKNSAEVGEGAVYLTIGTSNEIANEQFIGQVSPPIVGLEGDLNGSFFETKIKCAVYSVNILRVVYIATITKWILLNSRLNFEENFGLMEQKLALSDLLPSPPWFPDFAFRREIVYSCKHLDYLQFVRPTMDIGQIIISPEQLVDASMQFNV